MNKLKYLDGVRGFAAFIVVIHHYLLGFFPALLNGNLNSIKTKNGIELLIASSPLNLIYAGNSAVCIFFILSGYVLTYKFFKCNDERLIISSANRRYLRLLVPVLFSLVVTYVFMKLGFFYNIKASQLTNSDWLASYYNFEPNFIEMLKEGFWGVFFQQTSFYNPVLWTMYYEFYGSLLVLGFAYAFGKVRNRYIIYLIASLITVNTHFFPFILGVFLSDSYASKNNFICIFNKTSTKLILSILGLFLASYPTNIPVENTIYSFMKINLFEDLPYFYHTIGTFLILCVILNSYKLKKMFSNKIFSFLGSISFSLYSIHFLVLSTFSSYLFLVLNTYFKYYQSFLIMFIISLALLLIISYYIYKYIDLGGIRLSKYVYEKYFKTNKSL